MSKKIERNLMLDIQDPAPMDRMARYRKNPQCPECGAHPVICTSRRGNEAFYRCRHCGHRFGTTVRRTH